MPEKDVSWIKTTLQSLGAQWKENLAELARLQTRAANLQAAIDAGTTGTVTDDRHHLRELQRENIILSGLFRQHELTLEAVMARFRAQTKCVQRERIEMRSAVERALEEERAENDRLRLENAKLAESLATCVRVVREAIISSTDESMATETAIMELSRENETLRAMLGVTDAVTLNRIDAKESSSTNVDLKQTVNGTDPDSNGTANNHDLVPSSDTSDSHVNI